MSITVKFTPSSGANGRKLTMFRSSASGQLISTVALESHTVNNDTAVFETESWKFFGHCMFRLDQQNTSRWRSGPLSWDEVTGWANNGGGYYHLVPFEELAGLPGVQVPDEFADGLVFGAADLRAMLPSTPFTEDDVTINSMNLTVGNGRITVAGTGTYKYGWFTISFSFEYVFRLNPVRRPSSAGHNGPLRLLTVETIDTTVRGNASWLGFLNNLIVWLFSGMIESRMADEIESEVQSSVNAAVSAAFGAGTVPAGTTVTAEEIRIQSNSGVRIEAFIGIALASVCAATPTSGSVSMRSSNQLMHLRAIRDRLLPFSPRGAAYLRTFEAVNPELVRILISDEKLLAFIDEIVDDLLRLFPADRPGEGRLSADAAGKLVKAMDRIERVAAKPLAITLNAMKKDVEDFVDRPAGEVLAESLRGMEEKPKGMH